MTKTQDLGISQLPNGNWCYRFTKTVDGKRVLKGILDMCPSQDCFSTDSNTMSYQCGRMAIGLELRNFIKIHCGNDLLSSIEKMEI